ncbi:MAG: AbrB/MazE/SpoVT family DNA-binding domain-containing protein, partial [Candidatus Woesearchaeota archaeon]
MKRKVIQIADSTQLVSLPRKWCLQHGIRKGDEVEVEENGNKIQISTAKEALLETAKIHFSNSDTFLQRPLMTFYRLGYDQVEITFDDPQVIPRIQDEIERLMGFEIVNQTERSCVVKNVASAMDTEFESILRRIMLMLIEM